MCDASWGTTLYIWISCHVPSVMHYIRGRFREEKRGTKEIYQSSLMAPARLERAPPDTTFTVYCLKVCPSTEPVTGRRTRELQSNVAGSQ
jgi:hypothetical protein